MQYYARIDYKIKFIMCLIEVFVCLMSYIIYWEGLQLLYNNLNSVKYFTFLFKHTYIFNFYCSITFLLLRFLFSKLFEVGHPSLTLSLNYYLPHPFFTYLHFPHITHRHISNFFQSFSQHKFLLLILQPFKYIV